MTWNVLVYVEGTRVADRAVLSSLTVTHGRTDPTSQPAPATATVSFLTSTAEPEWFELGHQLSIYVYETDPDFVATLFSGPITDCTMDRSVLSVTGTSIALGKLARSVGTITTTADTVANVYAEAGGLVLDDIDPSFIFFDIEGTSTWPMVGVTWPRQPFLATMQTVATNDPGGVLVERPDGSSVVFVTGQGRQARFDTRKAVSGDAVVDTWQASKSLSTKVNRARVTYGDPEATVTAKDTADFDTFGPFDRELTTQLDESADATYYARYLVARGVNPGWSIPTITVDANRWADTEWFVFDGLVTSVLEFDTVPTPYLPAAVCVEGWTHRINGRSWMIDFYVSDPALTLPNQTWEDLADTAPTLAWNAVTGTITWDDLLTSNLP